MCKLLLSGLAILTVAAPALAQRDPAYQAARAAGEVGEQPDGYLGFPGTPSASLRALVNQINIQRKATYTEKAQAANVTVADQAFTFGCNLIQQTQPGEKYRTPSGEWKTRGGGAPERDSRCL